MTSFLFSSPISNSIGLNVGEEHASGTKRLHSFEEESERNQLKKRRKQSKPVRIANVGDAESGETELGHDHEREREREDTVSEDGNISSDASDNCELKPHSLDSDSKTEDGKVEDANLEVGQNNKVEENVEICGVKSTPLNLSKASSGDSDLSVDVLSFLEKTQVSDSTKNELESETQSSLPAYHQYQGPYQKHNSGSEPYASLPSTMVSSFKQFRSPTLKSPIGLAPLRIFNPEAFCNLCNKEFCNKYFLKTHKANKHGIYSDNLGVNPLDSYNTDYSQNSLDISNANPAVKFWFSRKPFSLSSPSTLPRISANMQNSNGSVKAFCNICQREFCNKYFVRRHKAKIHGIIEPADGLYAEDYLDVKLLFDDSQNNLQEYPKNDLEENGNKIETELNNFSQVISIPPGPSVLSAPSLPPSSETAVSLCTPVLATQANVSVDSKAGFESNSCSNSNLTNSCGGKKPVCEICEKEFCSRHSLRRHKAKVHGIRSSVISTSLGQDVLVGKMSNEDRDSSRCSFSESESVCVKSETQEDSEPDRRDLDSLSKASFENENRLEDRSRFRQEDEDSDSHSYSLNEIVEDKTKDSYSESPSPFPGASVAPLNLVLSSSHSDNYKTNQQHVPHESETTQNSLCDLCGKNFQTQFLLSMHKTYFHNFPEVNSSLKHDTKHSVNFPNDLLARKQISLSALEDRVKKEHHEEEIQKLHSLIMKLNNLNVEDVTVCEVCNEDLGHISCLENHILREHGELLDEVSRMIDEEAQPSPHFASNSNVDSKLICRVCQSQFSSLTSMDQHVCVSNSVPNIKIPQPSSVTIGNSDKNKMDDGGYELTQQKLGAHLNSENQNQSQSLSTSFCDICKKELCNKYFMKTHMQRMHNISIETGANVGGVVCDICNKTLCSKYFLRVHKQNSHGIVDEVLLPPRLWMNDVRNQSPNSIDASLKPSEKTDFSYKYFTHFTEVCSLCSRRFRSTKWLRAHLLNDHGEEGKLKWLHYQNQLNTNNVVNTVQTTKTPESQDSPLVNSRAKLLEEDSLLDQSVNKFSDQQTSSDNNILVDILNGNNTNLKQCNYCPFSTKILALLFMHERTHLTLAGHVSSDSENGFQCPLCREKFTLTSDLEKHLASHYNISLPGNSDLDLDYKKERFKENTTKRKDEESKDSRLSELDSKVSLEQTHMRENTGSDLNTARKSQAVTEQGAASGSKHYFSLNSNKRSEEKSDSSKTLSAGFNASMGNSSMGNASMGNASMGNTSIGNASMGNAKGRTTTKPEPEVMDTVSKMKEALSAAAVKTNLPTTFAIPRDQDSYIMQPFFLENFIADQLTECSTNHTFLSSLVYLPVKQKLSKSVTASFRLTPT